MVAYAHKGRGAVIMTNGDGGASLMMELRSAIARAYEWDDYVPKVYSPMADQEPDVASKVVQSVRKLAAGEIDLQNFSPSFQEKLHLYIEAYKEFLAPLGHVETVSLIAREQLQYRIQYLNSRSILYTTLPPDRTIL